ncbi:hypothetical protein R3P82_12530 [Dietzia maris]|uniref:Lipoprotein n=1 Tax=Dietzia maris TaxID=37915 RepID=A0AAE4QXL8_9ACTN|nr:hypothetical protein [Dietzia maris]MDV6299935.1 hypothetical protein [Dietzia maris]
MKSSVRHGLIVAVVCTAAVAGACSSGRPEGLSLDQQQQAWEEEVEREVCEFYREVGEKHLALGQSMDTIRTGSEAHLATPRLDQSGCTGATYGRYLYERLHRQFPDSPKGQAGETTSPSAP